MSTRTVTATLLAALISVSSVAACGDRQDSPSSPAPGGGGNSQKQ